MFRSVRSRKGRFSLVLASMIVILVFALASALVFVRKPLSYSYAFNVEELPPAGKVLTETAAFTPATLRGIKVNPDNPFTFDFILDEGGQKLTDAAAQREAEKLTHYFLAALTVPQDALWVNLSVFEQNRVISDVLGQTEMGKDMLAEDYILKQILASFLHPDTDAGKAFWAAVYGRAEDLFGTTDIPVDTFNKIWIVPDKAVVYEQDGQAVISESRLRVMLEGDYKALKQTMADAGFKIFGV